MAASFGRDPHTSCPTGTAAAKADMMVARTFLLMPGIGDLVGHVRLVAPLGAGGMGEVWEGTDEHLGRRVAVKAVRRRASGDDAARQRFAREARLLSRLEHPNICRVYEWVAGDEEDYLVLELVRGRTLRRVIEEGLGAGPTLDVAIGVCSALAAAHAVSVIHRDLKPDNVMLSDDGAVKVLDFGLARHLAEETAAQGDDDDDPLPDATSALDLAALDSASLTHTGEILGTPLYMCPEQARGEPPTAAGDMFGFGLLLFEMLSGRAPYAADALPEELMRRAMWGELPPLSGVDRQLATLVRDLTELDPSARPTAEATLRRLRHLKNRPVRRLRRLMVAVAALGLVTGTVLSLLGLARARSEAATARATTDFVVDLFRGSDPHQGGLGPDATARAILVRGAERLHARLGDQPATRARLLATLGSIYGNLGLDGDAVNLLEEALALQEGVSGPDSAELLPILTALAGSHSAQGQWQETSRVIERAVAIAERTGRRTEHATALNVLGVALSRQAHHVEAEAVLRRALTERTAMLGSDHPDTAAVSANLALVLLDRGRYQEADERLTEALAVADRTLAPDDPDLALIVANLATAKKELGLYDEAEALCRRALETTRRRLGREHPETALATNNLAVVLFKAGRYAEAEAIYREAVGIAETALGPTHFITGLFVGNLAEACSLRGRAAEAEPLFRRALTISRASFGDDHPAVADQLRGLARVVADQGRPDESEALLKESLRILEKVAGPDHADVGRALAQLGELYLAQGRTAEAADALQRARAILEAALGEDHPDVLALPAMPTPGEAG